MRVFEMIGPVMFGPSSMHTAGACRVARAVWQIAGQDVREAHLELHGAFRVREGGQVNTALVAGLLGYDTDNDRLHHSLEDAAASNVKLTWENTVLKGAHNNTVRYTIKCKYGELCIAGVSIGGGMIEIQEINGAPVSITGDYHTAILFCSDAKAAAETARERLSKVSGLKVEDCASEDGKTQLVLVKTPKALLEENNTELRAIPGVTRMTGHTMFE